MNKIIKKPWGLTVSLVIFIFLILLATMILVGGLFMVLHHTGLVNFFEGIDFESLEIKSDATGGRADVPIGRSNNIIGFPFGGVFSMLTFSAFLGTVIAWFFSKTALRPIRKIIDATHKVASGDFDVRLDIHSIYELEELSNSFNKMTHELASIETLRSDFINNMSHEFKTPIVSIKGFAELLSEGNLSEKEQKEYLEIIITESKRLSLLSTNVLSLAKLETTEIIPESSVFRIDEQLRKAVLQLENIWTEKNITVEIEADTVEYNGDPDLIQQVLLNLTENAIKFTNPGGIIDLRLLSLGDNIYISVKDNGIGMDEQTMLHIFDKFYQGDTSRSKQGNGIGLSIVKRIIDLCGGNIKVISEKGKGSEFTVTLPLRS